MAMRTRHYIVAVMSLLLAIALSRLAAAGDWSKAQLYAAGAGLIVVICLTGGIWVGLAPDGDLRRRRRR